MPNPRSWLPRRSGARRTLVVLLVLVAFLIGARAVLPTVLRWQINQRLAAVEGFRGHVEGIDLALWRGAYQLQGLDFERFVDGEFSPFLKAAWIDFSVNWRALMNGRIRSEIAVRDAHLIYVPVDRETETPDLDRPDWRDVVTDLFPIDIARLTIRRGRLEFRDEDADPPVDISLQDLELTATGLSNRRAAEDPESKELPAWIEATGTTIGGGAVDLRVSAAPLASEPLFDLDVAIENVSLPALNDYLRAYSNVDVSEGNMRLYIEIAARDGAFDGYVKPLFDNLDFSETEEQPEEGLTGALWEGFVNLVATLFQYPPRDQVGTRIPISGEFGEPNADIWTALGNLFRHGFIEALSQQIEGLSLQEIEPSEAAEGEEGAGGEGDEAADGGPREGALEGESGLRPEGPPSQLGR